MSARIDPCQTVIAGKNHLIRMLLCVGAPNAGTGRHRGFAHGISCVGGAGLVVSPEQAIGQRALGQTEALRFTDCMALVSSAVPKPGPSRFADPACEV